MENTADVLRAAADRISKPGAWTQRAPARMADGNLCYPTHPEARAWCAIGAIYVVTPDGFLRRDAQAMAECLVPRVDHDLAKYNDAKGRKAATVARLLRKAADRWEAATKEEAS